MHGITVMTTIVWCSATRHNVGTAQTRQPGTIASSQVSSSVQPTIYTATANESLRCHGSTQRTRCSIDASLFMALYKTICNPYQQSGCHECCRQADGFALSCQHTTLCDLQAKQAMVDKARTLFAFRAPTLMQGWFQFWKNETV